MTRSLKERYVGKRLEVVQERAKQADAQLLNEQKAAQLLVEAMSDQDLEKVGAIVKKLDSIKTPELPKLKAAIEQAEAELNKYTAGGPITAAWTKLKSLVGIDNPVVKITTFADALEKGFSQVPQILKNNGISLQNVDLSKSLTSLLNSQLTGAKSDKDIGNTPYAATYGSKSAQNEADKPSDASAGKLKIIVDQLRKALSPGGIFGAFKKVPYIDSQELAQELVSAPLRVFSAVAKRINAGAKAAEIAPDMKSLIVGQGQVQTKGYNKVDPTKKSGQTQPSTPPTSPTVPTQTTPTGEPTPKPQGGGAAQNYAAHGMKIINYLNTLKGNPNAGPILAKKFMDAGLDPDKL